MLYCGIQNVFSRFASAAHLCLVSFLLLCPNQVFAERFDDWELVCSASPQTTPDDQNDHSCRLQQALGINGGEEVVFLLNFAIQNRQTVAIISTPLNVFLPAGIELTIDKGQSQRAVYETCNVSGCHAGFVVNASMLAALRKGSHLNVSISDTKKTSVPISVSLRGITAGLTALDAGKNQ